MWWCFRRLSDSLRVRTRIFKYIHILYDIYVILQENLLTYEMCKRRAIQLSISTDTPRISKKWPVAFLVAVISPGV